MRVPIEPIQFMRMSLGPRQHRTAITLVVMYFLFKFATLAVSAGAIYLGYKLFILGVTGHASLVVNSPSVSGQLLNAAPGLFFAIGGIVALIAIVWKGVQVNTSSKGPDGTVEDTGAQAIPH